MAMQYLNQIKNRRRSSQILKAPNPVLTEEEEAYLRQVTSQAEDSQLKNGMTPRDKDGAQAVVGSPEISEKPLSAGEAGTIPLPASPGEELGKQLGEAGRKASMKSEDTEKAIETAKSPAAVAPAKKKRWSTMFWKKNGDTKKVRSENSTHRSTLLRLDILMKCHHVGQGCNYHRQRTGRTHCSSSQSHYPNKRGTRSTKRPGGYD